MQRSLSLIFIPLLIALAGCENVRVGGSFGSFGSSGGVGVSASTDLPTDSTKNPPPIEQLFFEQSVITALFPAKELPFNADPDEVKALTKYAGTEAGASITTEDKEKLSACRSKKALCRIQLRP